MKNLTNIGRIMFAMTFLVFGIMHLANPSALSGLVPDYLPGSLFLVYLTGIAQIVAAVSIITQKYIQTSTLLLGVLLVIYVFTIHIPGMGSTDQSIKMMSVAGLLKDIGLAGAALMISGQSSEE